MSGHTPGPWKISPYSSIVGIAVYGDGIVIAGVRGGKERSEADARLIAAAPDLLQWVAESHHKHGCPWQHTAHRSDLMKLTPPCTCGRDALLAKLEGPK